LILNTKKQRCQWLTNSLLHTSTVSQCESQPDSQVCPYRECPVELLACCCWGTVSSGLGGESSSQHGCHECQIVVHQAGTAVQCWFIPDDSIWLHGWQAWWAYQ